MRVALYGGSFNPPHVCHVMTVAYVLSTQPVDAVWVMPVGRHAFAKGRHLADYAHRHRMCELAMEPFGARVLVCDVEHRLPGTSRTIDTVDHLRAEHPAIAFSLVVGTDLLAERHQWKDFDRLERTVPLVVIGRAGAPTPDGYVASPPLPDVSSRDIRRRLSAGQRADGLVPRGVWAYVIENGLYQGPVGAGA
ncbi:MAG: putative nicotinate-nucleotide adenylyltransferase [Myxococcales bacterium]